MDCCGGPPLSLRLAYLGRVTAAGLGRRLAPLGLDPRQYQVLAAVSVLAGCPQRSITDRAGIPASRVVAIVDGLESRGLLERVASPADRRAHALRLTPTGTRLQQAAEPIVADHERSLLAGLDDRERAVLTGLLGRLEPGA